MSGSSNPGLGLRLLSAGLILWLAVMLAGLLWSPAEIWLIEYHGMPGNVPMIGLACCACVVFLMGTYRRRVLCNTLLSLILAGVYVLTVVQPLGDSALQFSMSRQWSVRLTELLSNAVFEVIRWAIGRDGLFWVAPVCGFLTAYLLLSLCDKLFLSKDSEHRDLIKKLCCLSVLASSWHVLFFRGFVEATQMSIPFLLVAVSFLCDYRRGKSTNHKTKSYVFGCVFLTLAALFQGHTLALVPVLTLVALFGASPDWKLSRKIPVLILGHVFAVLTVGVALGVMAWSPWRAHPGLFGDEGAFLFVPWTGGGMMELRHLQLVANIILFASPLTLFLPALLASNDPGRSRSRAVNRHPALLFLALAYCVYVFCVNFGLLFPGDWDLMLGMGILLHLFLLPIFIEFVTASSARRTFGVITLLVGAAMSWSLMSSVTIPQQLEHPLGAAWEGDIRDSSGRLEPVLFVNGKTGVVNIRRGESAVIEVRPPGGRTLVRQAVVAFAGELEKVVRPEALFGADAQSTGPRPVTILATSITASPGSETTSEAFAPWIYVALGAPHPASNVCTVLATIELETGVFGSTNAVIIRWPGSR